MALNYTHNGKFWANLGIIKKKKFTLFLSQQPNYTLAANFFIKPKKPYKTKLFTINLQIYLKSARILKFQTKKKNQMEYKGSKTKNSMA